MSDQIETKRFTWLRCQSMLWQVFCFIAHFEKAG